MYISLSTVAQHRVDGNHAGNDDTVVVASFGVGDVLVRRYLPLVTLFLYLVGTSFVVGDLGF